jgi:hypothetical protein
LIQSETNDETNKSAPTQYEALVAGEMRKGFTETVAKTRIANWYGVLPDEAIAKASYSDLREVAQEIVDRDGGSRCDALRKARLSNEDLYQRLNLV